MSNANFKEILNKYNKGECSYEEKILLETWYSKLQMTDSEFDKDQIAIIHKLEVPGYFHQKKSNNIWPWIAAASIILFGFIGLKAWLTKQEKITYLVQNHSIDVPPGSDKAILKLSNGEEIILDNQVSGTISTSEDVVIQKNSDGSITYINNNNISSETLMNSIITPKGGQYQLYLSDGTKVWLNANSSITYPTKFERNKREIEIRGEVYLEVVHNKIPFIVKTGNQKVEVLGTHFNIKAYADEKEILTTLLEGAVRVSTISNSKLLKPNEQSILTNNNIIQIKSVDASLITAWKDGDFIFQGESIYSIMRTLSRWYDIEVDYSNYKDLKETFSGEISRERNLSMVLKMLERTNSIKFHLVGKTLYINN